VTYIWDWDGLVGGFGWKIVEQVLDQDGALSNLASCMRVSKRAGTGRARSN
jgi:hypothetical protein